MREIGLAAPTFADDVREYLQRTPRQLPSRYLYDALGSALFDAICELPWYRITRAENRLIAVHRKEIFASLPGFSRIIELGPGDGRKLHTLLDGTSNPMTTHLVDVSAGALARAAHTLSDLPHVMVALHESTFEEGLDEISRDADPGSSLVLLLGSNIGNFDPPAATALLQTIGESIGPGGALLIGADLVKPERDLLLAYDDPLGVSAAFNLNVLLRINSELGGTFDLTTFRHQALWNPRCARVEMSLVSQKAQHVRIDSVDLDLELAPAESIWTESSYKYTSDSLRQQLEDGGFDPVATWVDRHAQFALALALARAV